VADRLVLQGMHFFAHHGDSEAEREAGARFDVDVDIDTDLSTAARSDSLEDTVNYASCFKAVRAVVQQRRFRLLETLAEAIASELLQQPRVLGVRVRVAKRPPMDADFERFAVVLERRREPSR
jgi:7,8-dihydroneopterin aldolase/epimerase/oxygenase